ncbi:MAG TPA: 50S ribosomal protein L7/L12 [Candidatus Pacearchaeota archaeon]|nr:50S ribosomal protein L7/L12 [Candidatus Pacearchaeota archaeon]
MAEENKTIEIPTKFKKIVEEIETMSVLDLSELVKILEEKFGVSAAPQMVAAAAAPAQGDADAGEAKSEFNVVLASVGDKKIEVIKVVRDTLQIGLKEAKDLVDGAVTAPAVVKEGVKKEEAEAMKKSFEEAGATVELK